MEMRRARSFSHCKRPAPTFTASGTATATARVFVTGEMFISAGAGRINRLSPAGDSNGVLDTTTCSFKPDGRMCLDAAGNL
jgi:hypothetical protein